MVRNFVYESLARNIEPIVIEPSGLIDYAGGACLLIRAAPGVYLPNLLDNLKKTYSRYPSLSNPSAILLPTNNSTSSTSLRIGWRA